MSAPSPEAVARLARALIDAERVLCITGAGLSADSGLPTYRGVGGLYEDIETDDGVPIELALSGAMFEARPDLTWRYIHQIEAACRGAAPNAGHEVLARLAERIPWLGVLTQNVDGFHRRAGSGELVEIHGDLHDLHCTACTWAERVADYRGLDPLPRCPRCDAIVRPRVVLFGEMLPPAEVERWMGWQARDFDLVISIGTTSAFPYIAEPVVTTARRGGLTIEINPGDTEVSDLVDLRIRAGARDTLVATWRALEAGASG